MNAAQIAYLEAQIEDARRNERAADAKANAIAAGCWRWMQTYLAEIREALIALSPDSSAPAERDDGR